MCSIKLQGMPGETKKGQAKWQVILIYYICFTIILAFFLPPSSNSGGQFSRFLELGALLEPGRPPKTDKAAILVDAVRMVTQLRTEAQKLKDSNSNLQDKIKELKVRLLLLTFIVSLQPKEVSLSVLEECLVLLKLI